MVFKINVKTFPLPMEMRIKGDFYCVPYQNFGCEP